MAKKQRRKIKKHVPELVFRPNAARVKYGVKPFITIAKSPCGECL